MVQTVESMAWKLSSNSHFRLSSSVNCMTEQRIRLIIMVEEGQGRGFWGCGAGLCPSVNLFISRTSLFDPPTLSTHSALDQCPMSNTYSPYIHQTNQNSPHTANFSQRDDDLAEKHESDYWSGNDSGAEGEEKDGSRKRKRPMSVSCELCKQRKVKCDRGQPTCGWCSRNGQLCEYKERKKPGLRAGYGRELESRLGSDKLNQPDGRS